MSRAEEMAFNVYPQKIDTEYDKFGNSEEVDYNEPRREGFIRGYEQAEKDLLTWENVRSLCDAFMDVGLYSDLPARSKELYEEVLRRFNEQKNK